MQWATVATNAVLALIWLVYLTLFFRELRSRYRVRVFVQQQGGYGLDSHCMLVNLSDQPVSVDVVSVYVALEATTRTVDLTGMQVAGGTERGGDPSLVSGATARLGSFREILARALHEIPGASEARELGEEDLARVQRFEIRAVVMHGGSDHPLPLARTFHLERGERGWGVVPDARTQRWSGRRGRALARSWLHDDIAHRGLLETHAAE